MSDDQEQIKPSPNLDASANELEALPLLVSPGGSHKKKSALQKLSGRLIFLPLIFLMMFIGAVIGVYTQPVSLQLFMEKIGLEPGGGNFNPLTLKRIKPVTNTQSKPEKSRSVVALGRLIPRGDVTIVAMPYGAGDARINSLNVKVGQRVSQGQVLAVLDNQNLLQSTVKATQANVALKKSMLTQTRSSIAASLKEANAVLGRAQIAAQMARKNFKRQE